jgi:competence protein ComEC
MPNNAPLPPPPRVAPLAPLALAIAAGIVIDRYAAPWGTICWTGIALIFGALSVVVIARRGLGLFTIVLSFTALAGGWHHYRWFDVATDDISRVASDGPKPAWVRGVLRDMLGYRPGASVDDSGVTRAVLEIAAVRRPSGWQPASGRTAVSVVGDRSDLRAGTTVQAAGSLALVARPLNPGEFDYRALLRAQGVRTKLVVDEPTGVWTDSDAPAGWRWWWVRWLGFMRSWSQTRLARGLDPSTAPLAAALLLGRREGVDPDVNDAFARTGTTHLLAISGLHLQVLALALGGSLRWLGLGRRTAAALVVAATLAYALLVGLMPSVVRSAAMTVMGCLALILDRANRPADTFAAASITTLVHNPSDLFDVGCQLSFLAVAAILWGVELAVKWITPEADRLTVLEHQLAPRWRTWCRGLGSGIVHGLVVSAVVWLAGLPLVALRFHLVAPIGILLNVPLIPMTSLALLAAGVSLGLSAVWEPLGYPAARLCSLLLEGTERVVFWGVSLRGGHGFVPEPSLVWVLGFYVALGLATASLVGCWPGRRKLAMLAFAWTVAGLVVAVLPRRQKPLSAEVLAVGHGLAVLIETGRGRAVLYDCGRMRDPTVGRRVVAPALWARGIRGIDAVILSHADADHYCGLPDLLDRIPVAVVVVPEGFASPSNPGAVKLLERARALGVAVRTVAAGEHWEAGAAQFAILHPPPAWNPDAPDNARSLVLDVRSRGRHALFTGDLEGEGLRAFASVSSIIPLDAVLAPHHGGRAANPAWFYDRLEPAVVVASQRPPQLGGRDALEFLEGRGIPVARTWQRGALRLTWSEAGIAVRGFLDE